MTRRTFLGGRSAGAAARLRRRAGLGFRLTDVTAAAGIHFRHNSGAFGAKYLPETWAPAARSSITMAMAGWTFCW